MPTWQGVLRTALNRGPEVWYELQDLGLFVKHTRAGNVYVNDRRSVHGASRFNDVDDAVDFIEARRR